MCCKLATVFVLVVTLCLSAYSQLSSQGPTVSNPSAYEGQKVGSIDLSAKPYVDLAQYRSLIEQKVGQPYSQKKIDASIQALKQTNEFSNATLKVVPDPSGLKLTFVLEPAYYIGLVEFPGALNKFTYARMLQAVNFSNETLYQKKQLPSAADELLKLFRQNGYFQAHVNPQVVSNDVDRLANITFHVDLGPHAHIGKVQVVGPPPPEQRNLEDNLRSIWARFLGGFVKTGKPFNAARLKAATARIQKELGKQHYPANSVMLEPPSYQPKTNLADITFKVSMGPKVQILIQGASLSWIPFLATREKKKLIPIYDENAVDPDLVAEGERNLTNFFEKKGYFDVKVHTDFQHHDNNVLITYQIDKGHKYSVAEISFRGNHHISSGDLENMIVVKEHTFLISHGAYSPKLLKTSIGGIEVLYQDNGFEDIKVTPDVMPRGTKLYLTFNIAEGDRTTVNALAVEGNTKIPLAQLRPKGGFQSRAGRPYSPKSVANDRDTIAAKYLNRGYLNSNVDAVVSRVAQHPHEVDVTYKIAENQQVRISKVIYLGQQHTQKDLLKVATNLHVEEPMSEGKLLEAESNLYDLGIFDWASVGPRRQITTEPQEDALVKVHESKRNSIVYGFGLQIARRGGNVPTGTIAVPGLPTVGTNGANLFPTEKTFVSPRGSLEYTRRNMRGLGETAAFSIVGARLDQRFLFTYTDPHFRLSTWQALTSVSVERNTENPLFAAVLQDASLEFQRYLNRRKTLQFQARYDFDHTQLNQLLVPQLVLPPDRNVKLSYLSGTVIHDTRDQPLDAHHGWYQTVDFRVVPTAFGSSANFLRLFMQHAYYKPLPAGMVFANSFRLGLASPFSGSRVPTSERFFAGGGTTLRGFPINEAGPIRYVPFCAPGQSTNCAQVAVPVGGNQLVIINSELRFPIPIIHNLGGALFYDGGNVYRRINFADFLRNYSNTVGFGFRYATPLGPVRIDIGRNLNPPAGISATQFFITLGQAF